MNRTTRALATFLTTTTACAGLFLAGGPAQAATPPTVAGDDCTDRGVTNYYVHHWQNIPGNAILNSTMRFHEHRCDLDDQHFRLYKSTSDTEDEVTFAKKFLADQPPAGDPQESYKPTVFCQQDASHAYFLDLAFYWGMGNITGLNDAERNHYDQWAQNYADAHDCRLYSWEPTKRHKPSRRGVAAGLRLSGAERVR